MKLLSKTKAELGGGIPKSAGAEEAIGDPNVQTIKKALDDIDNLKD